MTDTVLALESLHVSRETKNRLERFIALFEKWARSINLVAPSTLGDFGARHIQDSAQIFQLNPNPQIWVDLGSGGGFPGMITAILLNESDGGWVHLIESNNKKAAFLRTAIAETGARASVHPIRIESAPALIPQCDAISARALADLSLLLQFSEPWMINNPNCRAYFHKGRDYQVEVDKAVGRWSFDLVQHQSVVERDSVVLEITNLSRIIQ
ncbi:16S rRNA (guanine(527)-N(7))-methyltransferase RsmG [Rhizobium sp. ARZ01]|uniref:16S rRNA (guanine(527)-N(7))-methyltransferase RsmG n=1 Tax=Rhizobium sp. ARZ01 TaxID=2769313 RepID=UPI00177AAB25|nr:16S rRNA (guanine(527)-N(7))-methyltransferase RsmG [Rhizobium sp. ARZ01]MBD9374493.1 16S rRNA (guanine(527)-N(7))-methyltransferase RsmG [Rhizobium sp. ARZ01]